MPRYDRQYDYGLRGYQETARPRLRRPPFRLSGYGGGLSGWGGRASPLPNRVTAPYNMDYIRGGSGEARPHNYSMYTGDRPERMGDERLYRQPYITRGGTWTSRGATYSLGYDYPTYGPNYGGRYPDEL
jgi:hypothetical protein